MAFRERELAEPMPSFSLGRDWSGSTSYGDAPCGGAGDDAKSEQQHALLSAGAQMWWLCSGDPSGPVCTAGWLDCSWPVVTPSDCSIRAAPPACGEQTGWVPDYSGPSCIGGCNAGVYGAGAPALTTQACR